MTKYVAGLLFNDERDRVALILKDHGPASLIGKWNAIGGKRLHAESASKAMEREFLEEAGVSIENWELFLTLKGCGREVDFFCAFSTENLQQTTTMEREVVMSWYLEELPVIVPNLTWIIPMALGHKMEVYEVIELEPRR